MNSFDFPEICRRSPADEKLSDVINELISHQNELTTTVKDLQQEVATLKKQFREVLDVPNVSALPG